MEKNEPQSTEDIKDCMIVSSAYETYKKNIEFDRSDKTLGQWHIKEEYIPHIKFVYVYLNFSGQMLIKKYEVEKFEHSKKEKGWNNPIKYSFIFKKSENIISGKLINIKIMLRCFLDSLSNRFIIVNRNKHQKNINSFSGLTI